MSDREPLERLGFGDHSSQLDQVVLIEPITCPICGHEAGLFVPYGDRIACVECVEKENGEDGDG